MSSNTPYIPEKFIRNKKGRLRSSSLLLLVLVLFLAVVHIIQLWTLFIPSSLFKTLHLCLGVAFIFLSVSQKTEVLWQKVFNYAMVLFSSGCMIYIFLSFDALINERMFGPSGMDVIIGLTLLVSAVISTIYVWGWMIPLISMGTLLYGYFGAYFPGDFFYHSGISFDRLISYTSIPFFEGLLGSMTGMSASLVFLFMLFAGLLKSTGGIDFILTLAARLGGRSKGGPGQIAVLGSGVMGMISGSTVANVASTGSITIPLMKKYGFPSHYAGAVESVASTGGQFMPPVMGLTAFLIVGITGTPYKMVMAAAAMPALIYYGNLLLAVHFHAVASDFSEDVKPGESKPPNSVLGELKQYGHLLAAICLLVALLITSMPPGHAAVIATLFIVLTETAKQLLVYRGDFLKGVKASSRSIIAGFEDGVRNGVQLAVIIAVIGILVDMLVVTGFAQKLSNLILDAAGQNLLALLGLAALACLVFGLGMPTPAAYSLVAVVGAPALVDSGINILAAHMFVFFCANMSAITPPVAVAALVGAKIADANYTKTAIAACRLGLPGFVLPFLFVLNPELLMLDGSWIERLTAFILTLIGFVALNVGLSGTLFRPRMPIWFRFVSLFSGICLLYPSALPFKIVGFTIFGVLITLGACRFRSLQIQN